MQFEELIIPGAFLVSVVQHRDDRGVFLEWFREDTFHAATGHALRLAQANVSVSRRGTLRGIHYADVPPGQAKYITCLHGSAYDVTVDLRVGSPTCGQWAGVLLDAEDRRAVYLGEGLGHAFMALADNTVISYLCSEPYAPQQEHTVHALDATLDICWPQTAADGSPVLPLLSPRDDAAPSFAEAGASGLLPSYADVVALGATLA